MDEYEGGLVWWREKAMSWVQVKGKGMTTYARNLFVGGWVRIEKKKKVVCET